MRARKDSPTGVLIQRKLAEILLRESKDPRFQQVTISRVEAARDNSFAKVYVSMFPSDHAEAVVTSLNRAAGFFSHRLGKALSTRNTPKLQFHFDAGFDYSVELEQTLRKVNTPEDEASHAPDSEH
jgi:ribosome-binding factor A